MLGGVYKGGTPSFAISGRRFDMMKKTDCGGWRFKDMKESKSISRKQARKHLRKDCLPADPVVIELFNDLQSFRHFAEDLPTTPEAQLVPGLESKAFEYLLTYFTTLEPPAWFGENKNQS